MQPESHIREKFVSVARNSLARHINERGCWRCDLISAQNGHFFYCLAEVLQFDRNDGESITHWLQRALVP